MNYSNPLKFLKLKIKQLCFYFQGKYPTQAIKFIYLIQFHLISNYFQTRFIN